jgi:hypothetical protein
VEPAWLQPKYKWQADSNAPETQIGFITVNFKLGGYYKRKNNELSRNYKWMFNQLPMYQLQGASAYKRFNKHPPTSHLGNPHKNLNVIHVAGTNGKAQLPMLSSIQAGYKVGLHTSPHLKDFENESRLTE